MSRAPESKLNIGSVDRTGRLPGIELDLFIGAVNAIEVMAVERVSSKDVEALKALLRIEACPAA